MRIILFNNTTRLGETIVANRSLEIGGIRGIRHGKFMLPDSGVLVMIGPNGAGKSTTLQGATDIATGDKTALRPGRDQEAGFVSICGAKMTIAKSTRRSGEAEVRLFGSDVIQEIVDPGVEDGAKADLRRMKGIARAKGAKPDATFFAAELELSDDEMGGLFPDARRSDLVDYCATGKKQMNEEAGRLEKQAEQARADADAANRTAIEMRNGLPADLPTADAAQKQLEDALQQQTLVATAVKAKAKLEALGPAPDWDAIAERVTEGKSRLLDIDAQLERLRIERANLQAAVLHDDGVLSAKGPRDGLQEQADATDMTAEEAEAAVADARKLIGAVSSSDAAAKAEARNQASLREFNRLSEKAASMRTAAGKLDGLLAKSLNLEGKLQWKGDRLVDTSRADELFHVLSPGLRISRTVELLAPILPAETVIAIPQEFWEGLDEANKNLTNDAFHEHGLVALTAEARCTIDGELDAVVFENLPVPPSGKGK